MLCALGILSQEEENEVGLWSLVRDVFKAGGAPGLSGSTHKGWSPLDQQGATVAMGCGCQV